MPEWIVWHLPPFMKLWASVCEHALGSVCLLGDSKDTAHRVWFSIPGPAPLSSWMYLLNCLQKPQGSSFFHGDLQPYTEGVKQAYNPGRSLKKRKWGAYESQKEFYGFFANTGSVFWGYPQQHSQVAPRRTCSFTVTHDLSQSTCNTRTAAGYNPLRVTGSCVQPWPAPFPTGSSTGCASVGSLHLQSQSHK